MEMSKYFNFILATNFWSQNEAKTNA